MRRKREKAQVDFVQIGEHFGIVVAARVIYNDSLSRALFCVDREFFFRSVERDFYRRLTRSSKRIKIYIFNDIDAVTILNLVIILQLKVPLST